MYLQVILPIALVLVVLAGCFAGLFWRLASRFDAQQCTAEWLDGFSLESYAPMERLLGEDDVKFLASQPGYRPEIAQRLMAERRKIFAAYLGHLVRDFNQLVEVGKFMIVYSTRDQQEFARRLWRHQASFYWAVCSVRLRLAVYPLGWSGADPHRLVAAVTAMREQVVMLASPSPARFESAS
jgi:hypothetical protein